MGEAATAHGTSSPQELQEAEGPSAWSLRWSGVLTPCSQTPVFRQGKDAFLLFSAAGLWSVLWGPLAHSPRRGGGSASTWDSLAYQVLAVQSVWPRVAPTATLLTDLGGRWLDASRGSGSTRGGQGYRTLEPRHPTQHPPRTIWALDLPLGVLAPSKPFTPSQSHGRPLAPTQEHITLDIHELLV